MRKIISLVLALTLLASCFAGCAAGDGRITINVYNWGQYISEGDDGCIDVIALFQEAYPNIKVNYVTFDSNETMYTKMSNGGITVDVIIPSDYMVGRLLEEDMLLPLNFDNIPNAQYVDQRFWEQSKSFDPENAYSVPYSWGTVGIIYNSAYVDEEDVTGWELLWNEKYADKILMFDNSRDAFGITQCMLGYSINTTDPNELKHCAEKLREQRPALRRRRLRSCSSISCAILRSPAEIWTGSATERRKPPPRNIWILRWWTARYPIRRMRFWTGVPAISPCLWKPLDWWKNCS